MEIQPSFFEEIHLDMIRRTVESQGYEDEEWEMFFEMEDDEIHILDVEKIWSKKNKRLGGGKILNAVQSKIHLFISEEEMIHFKNFLFMHMKRSEASFELHKQKIVEPKIRPLLWRLPNISVIRMFNLSREQWTILEIARFNEIIRSFIYKCYLWSKHELWIEWEHFRKMSLIIHQKRTSRKHGERICFEIKISCDYSLMLEDIWMKYTTPSSHVNLQLCKQ